jgi:hypothetical protein
VGNAMRTCGVDRRYLCLDLFQVSWGSNRSKSSDSAILLEIGDLGGLLQTSVEIPPGRVLTMALPNGRVKARVSSCRKDDFGYLVEVSAKPDESWFPASYEPPYLKAKTTNPPVKRARKRAAAAPGRRKNLTFESAWSPAKGGRSHR